MTLLTATKDLGIDGSAPSLAAVEWAARQAEFCTR